MRRIFRKLFKPSPLPAMLDYLERNNVSGIFSVIVKGQPGGEKHEGWLLWKEPNSFYVGAVTIGPFPQVIKPLAFDRKQLEALLDEYAFWQVGDALGTVRDGIHYTLAFASPKRARLIRIWNPTVGSKQADFVQRILDLVKQCGIDAGGLGAHEK